MKTLYDGFLKIKERVVGNNRFEVMDRGDSVTVLIVKPGRCLDEDQFYIGEQYRAGADAVQFTQVAGMIDGGESPAKAAKREAIEEAGAKGDLIPIYQGYTSPGGCTENTHQFLMFTSGNFSEPTDKSEGIKWNWYSGWWVRRHPFNSFQLHNAIQLYINKRNQYLEMAR